LKLNHSISVVVPRRSLENRSMGVQTSLASPNECEPASLQHTIFPTRTLVILSIAMEFHTTVFRILLSRCRRSALGCIRASVSSECGYQVLLAKGNWTIRYVRAETGLATRRDCVSCKPTSRTSKFYAEEEFVNPADFKGSSRGPVRQSARRSKGIATRHRLLESRIPRTLDETAQRPLGLGRRT
jgi:hypothetical protein